MQGDAGDCKSTPAKKAISKKKKKGIQKPVRRSKKIKNKFRSFKILYNNIRGLELKLESLKKHC